MKIQTVHRGDKDYAYVCTSKRIKGKDNPILIRRYLGVLDPETGLVTPKKVPPETFLAQIHDGEFTCMDLGNVLIAKSVAESLGIPETLERFFGDDYRIVYALVLSISVHPTYSSEYLDYVNNYHLEDVTGKSRITARDIDDALDDIHGKIRTAVTDMSGIERRYVFVIDDVITDDIHGRRTFSYGGIDGMAPGRMFFVITDEAGNPLILRSSPAGASVGESFRLAIRRADMTGGTNTFVLSRAVSSETLYTLASRGIHFMANMDHLLDDPDVLRKLTEKMVDQWEERNTGSRRCHVLEIGMGLTRNEEGSPEPLFGRIDELKGSTIILRAMAWYDHDEFDRLQKALSIVTRRRVEALDSMTVDDAREHLRDGSIEASFITVDEGEDGAARVSVRRKARREAAMLSSIHLCVSDHLSWEECIRCIDTNRSVVSHLRPIVQAVVDRKPRSGYSYAFLAFTAMRIRMELEKRVQEAGLGNMSAERVFQMAASYRAVNVNGYMYRSSIPRDAERLFDAFGIDVRVPSADKE